MLFLVEIVRSATIALTGEGDLDSSVLSLSTSPVWSNPVFYGLEIGMANWALVFGANPEGKVRAVSFLNFLLSFLFLCYQDPRPKEMFGERVLGLTDMAGIFSNVNIFFRLRLCHVRAALAFVTNTSTREAQRINPFILHRLLDTSNLHKFDEGFIKVNLNADMRPLRNIIHGALNRGEDCLLLKDVCSLQNWHREVISF